MSDPGRVVATMPTATALSDQDRAVLSIEHEYRHRLHQADKEQAARDRLGISAVRYAQIVNRLLDNPAAEAEFPQLIHRLRRLREARRTVYRAG